MTTTPLPFAHLKILVIDDDDLVRLTLAKLLQKQGGSVLEAKNGAVGIEIFKKNTPHIVLTDMLMPEKEGLETISELKSIQPSIKIIAMSSGGASHNMSFLQLAQRIGADKTISKPIKPDELIKTIKDLTT